MEGRNMKWIFNKNKLIRSLVAVTLLLLAGLPGTTVDAATLTLVAGWGSATLQIGASHSASFSAIDGTAPYIFTLTDSVPGLTFASNSTTASLTGTPTTVGRYDVSVSVRDSAASPSTVSSNFSYHVYSDTTTSIASVVSSHPEGELRVGYPVWVVVQLDTENGYPTTPSITVSTNNGGPSCTAPIDPDSKTGECALSFTSAGNYNITAAFAASGYFNASASAATPVTILARELETRLSAGRSHTCLINEDGEISCWGLDLAYTIKDVNGTITDSVSTGTYLQVTAGGYHTCALQTSGAIKCWGDSSEILDHIPNILDGKTIHYVYLDAGDDYACGIDTKNKAHCWGTESGESLGEPDHQFKNISVGRDHFCAVRTNGNVNCWGDNTYYQTVVPVGLNARMVAAGATHTCAIKTDGTVACWGTPDMTTMIPTGTFSWIESGNNYSCGLTSSGNIQCWGTESLVNETPSGTFSWVSSGLYHGCALQTGSGGPFLNCWGFNSNNKAPHLSFSPIDLPDFWPQGKPFSQMFNLSGGNEPYAFTQTGTLPNGITLAQTQLSGTPTTLGEYPFTLTFNETFTVGVSPYPLKLSPTSQAFTITVESPVTATVITQSENNVSVGSPVNITTTISESGTPPLTGIVTINGGDPDAECDAQVGPNGSGGWIASCPLYFNTPGTKSITATYNGDEFYQSSSSAAVSVQITPIVILPMVTSGDQFSCTVDSNGNPYCWGSNDSGKTTPPANSIYKYIDAGISNACAIKPNGRVECWGWGGYGLLSPPQDFGVIKVTSGQSHACALINHPTSGKIIKCWGNSAGNRTSSPAGGGYIDISAGDQHTCAINASGLAVCWGDNSSGQSNPSVSITFSAISAGGMATCGIGASDQAISCWGGTSAFRSSVPSGSFSQIDVGNGHACAVRSSDNTMACWGSGPSVINGSLSQVSCGEDHNCSLRSDGYLQCNGANDEGQAPVISIGPASFATLAVGASGNAQVTATGGRTTQYNYSRQSGALPTGLTIASTGAISGVVSSGFDFSYTIRVVEANRLPALIQERVYTQRVKGNTALQIQSVTPETGMVGKPVTLTLQAFQAADNLFTQLPTGVLQVKANGAEICSPVLVNGTASCTVFFPSPGEKALEVFYTGDERYLPANSTLQPVNLTIAPLLVDLGIESGSEATYIHLEDGSLKCVGTACKLNVFNAQYPVFETGDIFTCAIKKEGHIQCLQNGAGLNVPGMFTDLSVGKNHFCAIQTNGQILCQGENDEGQLNAPIGSYHSIYSGNSASCALDSGGNAACWGNIDNSTVPVGSFLHLSVGNGFACGLRADQSLACWGNNDDAQSSPPSGSLFTQVSAGDNFACGIDTGQEISCWGDDSQGQSQAPYGEYHTMDACADHACALRTADQLTCWGSNSTGEAPQILVDPLAPDEIVALLPWENRFDPIGGVKPYQGVISAGALPPGTSIGLSPAGVVAHGTPSLPGEFDFVIRWMDAGSPKLLWEEPYHLTVTGANLIASVLPAHPNTALRDNQFFFDYILENNTSLNVPDVLVTIQLPETGFENVVISGLPGCVLSENMAECTISSFPANSKLTVRASGRVTAQVNSILQTDVLIEPTLSNWPDIQPSNNAASKEIVVAYSSTLLEDDFEGGLGSQWLEGQINVTPGGDLFINNPGVSDQTVRLLLNELGPHETLKIRFEIYVIGPWQGNGLTGSLDPALFQFGETGETAQLFTTFSNDEDYLQAYPGEFPGSANLAWHRAAGVNDLGYDSGTVNSRYQIELKLDHSDSDLDLTWLALHLPDGAVMGIDNVLIELDSGWMQVYLPLTMR
jgi:alpha-tubulin suppressor-like RCC1 family protein